MDSPNSRRRSSCFAVANRRKRSTASSTRWCGMRPMRACSRAAGSNCTARLRAHLRRGLPTSWRASRKSWHTTSRKPALLNPPSITGSRLARRSANAEALNHLARGLELLPKIDDPTLRNKSELLLQTSLGHSLRATKGWSVDSVKQAYRRALQLCKESGFDEHTLPAVFGLWTWNFLRAALGEAQALAERLVNIAENVDDSVYKVLAHEALGFTLFAHGKFAAAHAALERSIGMCEDSKAAAYLDLSAQDPRVHVRLYDGIVLWLLGYPDQASRICAEARRYADTSQHPFSEAMARTISLRVHQLRGEAAVVARQANAAIALCEEHEFVHYLAMALILRGWAAAQQGEFEKGIAEIQEGLEKERATGALLFESYTLGDRKSTRLNSSHLGISYAVFC